jgi:hypothetical protein
MDGYTYEYACGYVCGYSYGYTEVPRSLIQYSVTKKIELLEKSEEKTGISFS